MKTEKKIIEQIILARKELKMTYFSLSKNCGVSTTYLWEIEKGRKSPTLKTLLKILQGLLLSIEIIKESINEQN